MKFNIFSFHYFIVFVKLSWMNERPLSLNNHSKWLMQKNVKMSVHFLSTYQANTFHTMNLHYKVYFFQGLNQQARLFNKQVNFVFSIKIRYSISVLLNITLLEVEQCLKLIMKCSCLWVFCTWHNCIFCSRKKLHLLYEAIRYMFARSFFQREALALPTNPCLAPGM